MAPDVLWLLLLVPAAAAAWLGTGCLRERLDDLTVEVSALRRQLAPPPEPLSPDEAAAAAMEAMTHGPTSASEIAVADGSAPGRVRDLLGDLIARGVAMADSSGYRLR